MKNISDYIKQVDGSIDRVEISVPLNYYRPIFNKMKLDLGKHTTKKVKREIRRRFIRNNKRIVVKTVRTNLREQINPRFYIQLLQPETAAMQYIYKLLSTLVPLKEYSQFNPCINQLEIAWDFVPHDPCERESIKEYLGHHVHLKYSRPGSIVKFKETVYIGKGGDARKGAKGLRGYPKDKVDEKVARLELQFNRKYLRDRNITIDLLPQLFPEDFRLFDHVEFLDDFSAKGLRNIARSVLRNRGYSTENTRKSRFRVNVLAYRFRRMIHGSVLGITNTVSEQIDRFKEIKYTKGITVAVKTYCQTLVDFSLMLVDKMQVVTSAVSAAATQSYVGKAAFLNTVHIVHELTKGLSQAQYFLL